jgi:putative ABC transport system ATP-binding protein
MDDLIRLCGVTKAYGSHGQSPVPVLRNIDLTIQRGEFAAIMGASGSGKSTLMNILGCLDRPTSGHYWLNGEDVAVLSPDRLAGVRSQRIGFVFQSFNLLPRIDVRDNIALPLLYSGIAKQERRLLAEQMLGRVGLDGLAGRLPNQLSGGQQQRVAIARALIATPDIVLADEPTGNLDSATSHDIMRLIAGLNAEHGTTVVLVTHEADIARFAKRVIHFVDGVVDSDQIPAAAGLASRALP